MAETKKSFPIRNDGSYLFLLYYNFCLWNYVKELNAQKGLSRASGTPSPSFAGAKVQHFRKPTKQSATFFEKTYIT